MSFNAFVVYDTASPYTVRGFGFNQAQADARAAENLVWTAHQGLVQNIPDSAIAGDFFFDVANLVVTRVAITAAGIIAERRNVLLTLLRAFERIDGLAAWTAGELNGADRDDLGVRGKSFSRWVEMMTRATALDANLSNDATHSVLLREANHPGRVWYWLHWAAGAAAQVNGVDIGLGTAWAQQSTFGESRLGWQWYSTTGPDAFDPTVRIAAANALVPNTRGSVSGAQVIDGGQNPALDSSLNWIHYLM